MKLRRTTHFALAAMLTLSFAGLTARAEQPANTAATSAQDLNLTDAQVFKIQAMLMAQTANMQRLTRDVQIAQESLSAAIVKGDPALTALAVLSLDAAEKALKNTELAGQRNLLSLLNDSQKRIVKDHSAKSAPFSD
jgi:hypothetical protein